MPSVADFVKTNARSLAELVRRRLPPLHDPEADGINPRIHRLLRGPKGPQGHIVTAAVKALGRQDDVVFAMAMGTGKTYSALATAHCHAEGRPYAVIVVCPPHLVKKWEREIRLTIPNPVVIHVPEWNQWLLLSKATRSMIQAPTFFVVPISRAKLGAKWVPAMLTSKRSGELTCPQCGSRIVTEDGSPASVAWLKKQKRFCPCGSALWQYTGFHKEMASKIVKRRMRKWFDYLIYDECFIGSTLVLMSSHEYKRIDSITPGESVLSWDGDKYVSRVVVRTIKSNRRKRLVRVSHTAGEVVCTEGHKFFTRERGYVAAEALTKETLIEVPCMWGGVRGGDGEVLRAGMQQEVSGFTNAASAVQEVRRGVQATKREGGVLQQELLGESQVRRPVIQGEDFGVHEEQKDFGRNKGYMVSQHEEAECAARDGRNEDGQSGSGERETIPYRARREWLLEHSRGHSVLSVEIRADDSGYRKISWCAEALQIGFGERVLKDRHRGGWGESQYGNSEGCRFEKGRVLEVERVESDPGEERGCFAESDGVRVESVEFLHNVEDEECVYDLEVEDTHCYFAGGVLVSNCHQAKSGETKAGDSLGHFINASRKQLILTGTIIAGKSEDLRHTFYRLNPRRFLDRGIGWNDKMEFARQYGRIESTVRYEPGKKGERARDKKQKVMAGIMPALYRDFVADRTIFLALKDMGIDMPKLIETPTAVDMSPEMSKEYARMKVALISKFMQLINENKTVALKLLATVAETLLSWPDDPVQKTVSYEDEFGKWHEIYTAPDMSRELLPKEKKLIEILKQEKAEGRQVWIYITRTATAERLLNILHTSGFATAYLTTRVDPEDREDWIAEFGPGVDCCVSHVKLVETGVDLFSPGSDGRQPYNFCTLLHY